MSDPLYAAFTSQWDKEPELFDMFYKRNGNEDLFFNSRWEITFVRVTS